MLNEYDIRFMENTVSEIINSWNDSLIVLVPLPMDQQTNWNPILKEGKMIYTKKSIPAERKYIVNNYDTNVKPDDMGDLQEGTILYAIPLGITIDKDMLFMIDGETDVYRLRSMRGRIGEILIILYRLNGIEEMIIQE